ncbi:uncharacterized protein LOC120281110 [Dioscorea cayenensis subsp. rotundata]|uniref:Uncharacterized protein LOC120281110 n=1 Tax=Dioscorea cayennensis subsp. rotundata TaxID=55577 RepID=A0AB40CXN9_DIOCR|nr:uncharacterized protein LOC120281110 [Dioscorea cayenensis subsp. rotundata]
MASSSSSSREANVPFFKGENYNLWSLMMKTMFRSKDLWSLVEKGFSGEGDGARLNESMKKDAKALFLIQQALDPRVLIRISEAKTAKEAWDIIKTEFQGDPSTLTVELHSLHREFDTARMKRGENMQAFVSRVLDVVHRIRIMGEECPQKTVVAKILRSLSPRISQVVHSLIAAKDLNTLTIDVLSGVLRSHELILNLDGEQDEDKALHVKSTPFGEHSHRGGRGRGRSNFRGRGRGRGRSYDGGHSTEASKQHKNVQCFICKKYGHVKAQCWFRNKEANVTEETKGKEEEEGVAFMACDEVSEDGGTGIIYSGCSNHMLGEERLFKCIEATPKQSIRLGDGKILPIEGVGTVALRSNYGKTTILNNVQFVPNLAHNLLSVGQLMSSGYDVEFTEGECIIKEAKTKIQVAHVSMTSHRLFPLGDENVGVANVVQSKTNNANLWHKSWVFFLERKSDALQQFKQFKLLVNK